MRWTQVLYSVNEYFQKNTRFSIGDLISAWQSVSYEPEAVKKIFNEHPNHPKSSQVFVMVSSQEETPQEDDWQAVDAEEAFCPLNKEGTILLKEHLQQEFDGSPEGTHSALLTLLQGPEESHHAFAERKLMAVLPKLVSTNEGKPELDSFIDDLNKWQANLHNSHKNEYEQILASTAFYYDKEHKRLIIRHFPEDTTQKKLHNKPANMRKQITDSIIRYLNISQNDRTELQIHYLLPLIIPGEKHNHIVLSIHSEYESSRIFDSGMGRDKINHEYLGFQVMNTVDCGRYVAAMTLVAFNLLALNPTKTAGNLDKHDFIKYVNNAGKAKSALELKAMIIEMAKRLRHDIMSKTVELKVPPEIASPQKPNMFTEICSWLPVSLWGSSSPSRSPSPNPASTTSEQTLDLPPAELSPCRV